jgi:hypothetical protein
LAPAGQRLQNAVHTGGDTSHGPGDSPFHERPGFCSLLTLWAIFDQKVTLRDGGCDKTGGTVRRFRAQRPHALVKVAAGTAECDR